MSQNDSSWAFEAPYARPLPSHLQFDPETGFSRLADRMHVIAQSQLHDSLPRVNPLIATYKTNKNKKSWVDSPNISEDEKEEYSRGATVTTAIQGWRASGSIGVVTSSLSSASAQSQGDNNWHTVAMARQGTQVWIHDSMYNAAAHAGNAKRVEGVHGTSIAHKIILEWSLVTGVWFQGPPSAYIANSGQMECMGRSAQWVEATVNGTLPWPPNKDSSGGQWIWHSKN
jgi:hypothetical protein